MATMTDSSAGASLSSVPSATTSTPLLAANPARRGCCVFNEGPAVLYVTYGPSASTTTYTEQIAGNTVWRMSGVVYQGPLSGVWSATGNVGHVTEWYLTNRILGLGAPRHGPLWAVQCRSTGRSG
jgi:hypothetical protein